MPHEVKPGEIYRDARVKVSAIPVSHGSWKYAYAYRFDAGGKVIVISGDTTPNDRLAEAARGCDILVHEVYSKKGWEARTPEWRATMPPFTPPPSISANWLRASSPESWSCITSSPWASPPRRLLDEIRENFHGTVIYGEDLEVIR